MKCNIRVTWYSKRVLSSVYWIYVNLLPKVVKSIIDLKCHVSWTGEGHLAVISYIIFINFFDSYKTRNRHYIISYGSRSKALLERKCCANKESLE